MDASVEKLHVSGNKCEVCQKQAVRKCGGCQKRYYCGKKHQKDDWKSHKTACRPFKVCSNVVTTRDVSTNEVIIKEAPLIWGPSSKTICLGCAKVTETRPCVKCGWPVCGDICEKSPQHLPECRYTTQRGRINDSEAAKNIHKCVTILRCLYHKQFLPKIWTKLQKLQTKIIRNNESIALCEFVRRFFKLWSIFTLEDVLKINTMIMVHGQEVPTCGFVAIYSTASFFGHSCTANCSKTFTESGSVIITAATPIPQATPLTLSYTNPLVDTQNRRYFLQKKYHFWCRCPRCEDPTEFGTYFSSLKCQCEDCDGYVLPEVPRCNKCNRNVSFSVHDVLERVQSDWEDLDKTNVKDCCGFLETYQNYLHKNHFYFVQVKLVLLEVLTEELELKVRWCDSLEKVVRVLAPGEKRVLGKVLFEKNKTLRERMKKGEDLQEESRRVLTEIVELLKFECEVVPEWILYQEACHALTELDETKQKKEIKPQQ